MAGPYAVQSKQGSLWHRWDPHLHTPGTALNDQFTESDPWTAFYRAIEASDPPIRALGITDYFDIQRYEQVLEQKQAGRLPNVGLIFPNVELRLGIETTKGSPINFHLLFSPEDADHVERIKRFLLEFEFIYQNDSFRCQPVDLIRLGKLHKSSSLDDDAARSEGANQFKVNFDKLKEAWEKNEWVRKNALIAVAGGEKDGTSGLRDATGSFAAQRQNIEAMAHIIFSANPNQIKFWLGNGTASILELEQKYHGPKPCLHGSDAHTTAKAGQPDQDRRCWIKGDLTFESLRQACIEPEERVYIGAEPPRGALDGNVINKVSVSNANWLTHSTILLNPGLVAIIGARGSGKTALADIIAAGGLALTPHLNERSFILRAKAHLGNSKSELEWQSGEITGNELSQTDMEELLDYPHVQYLSQQFVDQLCSSDGMNDALVDEIERVIFEAHAISDRDGASSFTDLLSTRLEASGEKRSRQQQSLVSASAGLADERAKKANLKLLEKERDETLRVLEKDKKDRSQLIPKGNEDRARRHEQISNAVNDKRLEVERAKRRLQAIKNLQTDVQDFRARQAPNLLAALKRTRQDAALSITDWNEFNVDFVGAVDPLLVRLAQQAKDFLNKLQGQENTGTSAQHESDKNVSLIPKDSNLSEQTLSLLEKEMTRIGELVGVDTLNVKRFAALSDKITKAEAALVKLNGQIEYISGSDERIKALIESRRVAYAGIFEAIVEEQSELIKLYEPIEHRINQSSGSLSKLSFSVRRQVDIEAWAKTGESLLDLRMNGPFKGRGMLLEAARDTLLTAWITGNATQAANALFAFVKANEDNLRAHRPEGSDPRTWARSISDWLYSTDHITLGYGLQYDGVELEQLSPGTRGIVLLLLYLAIDAEDERPLIVDQPEENLDPQSIFVELVGRFREARKRRQIIIVTHNANLVVNTDADQVIVASCGPHRPGQLPIISYNSGGLENPEIRQAVCNILEGGARAFKERARRLRVLI